MSRPQSQTDSVSNSYTYRGEASERARVVFPFSSHTPLRVVERTHYIKRSNSSSTSKVGLNLAPPLAILHMGFEISEIAMGLAH